MFTNKPMIRLSLLIGLLALLPNSVSAQMNTDHKEVKRRKIKTATALKTEYGDTLLTRFTYDSKGRLTGWYNQDGIMITYSCYDERGNKTCAVEILPSDTASLPVHADTASKEITRYVPGSGRVSYRLNVEYNGSAAEHMEIQSGDTVSYYLFPHGAPVLDGMLITTKIDSLKRTYAECFYSIVYRDSSYSLHCDTVFEHCNVIVYDKHGNPVQESYADIPPGAKPVNGKLYTPIGKPGTTLIVFANITYEYALDGSLKSSFRRGPYRNSQEEKQRYFPKAPFNSLQEIESRGSVTYTYYN